MTTLVLALAAAGWTFTARLQTGRWPSGGSWPGLVLGTAAGLIFLFETALVAKKSKRLRTARWLGSAQTWMKAHIWLGLLTVPLVILHSGIHLRGYLAWSLVIVFTAVIVSGLWGVALQNLLPKLLLDAVPAETIYSQIDRVGEQYSKEAQRMVLVACGGTDTTPGPRQESNPPTGAPRNVGLQIKRAPQPATAMRSTIESKAIQEALQETIAPFLERGREPRELLGSRLRNQWFFEDLRLRAPEPLHELVERLEELCERRRQLNVQRRLHVWLHVWLWVHLPLTAVLLVLLAGHVVLALRYQ